MNHLYQFLNAPASPAMFLVVLGTFFLIARIAQALPRTEECRIERDDRIIDEDE